MAGTAQHCIRYAWMVKQKRAAAYHHVNVKGLSFKPEFFIYAATDELEGVCRAPACLRALLAT